MKYIHLMNLISVGIFGMVLSAAFCDTPWTKRQRIAISGSMAVVMLLQGVLYFFVGPDIVEYIYPLITHLPLMIVLCILSRRRLWPTIAVLTAYLCCQLRRWLALLAVTLFSGDAVMQDVVELMITLPLLIILLRVTAPSVRSISHHSVPIQCQFGLVPALYYGFDYLTRVYTNMLMEGVLAAVEFMPFVCSVAYLIFVARISSAERIRSRLEQTRDTLSVQVTQAVREIEALRESQRKTGIYRHDLRHHMQYLSSCIENGLLEQAQGYIREIYSQIEANELTYFCKNEVANLVFSAFVERAGKSGIPITIKADIPSEISVSESDLCVLLSNAMENALHACQNRKKRGLPANIEVFVDRRDRKLFLQFINPCDTDVIFEQGIPVADSPGHGLGVRSICAIVEQYGGIYDFSVEGGRFILRVSL